MAIKDLILTLSVQAMLLGLLVILVRKRLHIQFPLFSSYVLYALLVETIRLSLMHDPLVYAQLYWATEAIYAILALLVIREVYRHLFPIEYQAYRWLRMMLAATIVLILSFSCWEALKNPPEHGHIRQMVSFVYWFDLGVHALEGLLFLLLVLLRVVLPVAWRRHEFGILIGLGLPAAVTTVADLLRFEQGSRYELLFRYAPPIAYILATMIWLQAFLHPPEQQRAVTISMQEMEAVLRRDSEELKKISGSERRKQLAAG
jgi:hypothetical protein